MILPKDTAARIAQGRCTQIRRPVTSARKPKIGHDYPICPGTGHAAICRIRILKPVRTEMLGDATLQDLKREGHGNRDLFRLHWIQWHDLAWLQAFSVDCDVSAREALQACALRFEDRWAYKLADILTFTLVEDQPRCLTSQQDILSGRSYDPLSDSSDYGGPERTIDLYAEAVDATTQRRFDEQARQGGEQQRASFRYDLEKARAESNGVTPGNLSTRDLRHRNGYLERQQRRTQ